MKRPLDLENRPESARFLEFLAQSNLAHPERLRDAADVMAGDEELLYGVEEADTRESLADPGRGTG